MKLKVADLRYTHDSIAGRFRDGRLYSQTIRELDSGHIDPLRHDNFLLIVVHWPGRGYFSLNNRRVHCLKLEEAPRAPVAWRSFRRKVRRKVRLKLDVPESKLREAVELIVKAMERCPDAARVQER